MTQPRKRPEITSGTTTRVLTGCGKLYVTINEDPEGLCEIIVETGKTGICKTNVGALGRVLSLALRAGVDVDKLLSQLENSPCPSAYKSTPKRLSCADAIAQVLRSRNGFKVKICKIKNQKKTKKVS